MILKFYGVKPLFQMTLFFIIQVNTSLLNTKVCFSDETEWVRLENHHTAIIDRALFEKANEMHPKKKRSVAE